MENMIRRKSQMSYRRCAFTGHRPQKLPWGFNENDRRCVDFKERLKKNIEYLIGRGYAHFLSGGALGMDTWAAEAVLELKEKYPWILLEMVSPFDGQANKWKEEDKARHDHLFAEADIVTAISHEYTKSCLFRRNRYLVDNADLVVALYDGISDGGTKMTVEYAGEMDVSIEFLYPSTEYRKNAFYALA